MKKDGGKQSIPTRHKMISGDISDQKYPRLQIIGDALSPGHETDCLRYTASLP
ncbi:MAG: hypothetical protein LKH27_07375 [Prevotella sp.]|nr:hypothetical protein [Prevotella sp.]MCH4186192.1 hypothetical protein [Prevotella sp.]MCH4251997.1 hypothetical protein [Prevotella sp.]MCI1450343.1 hypothetical protein [Prevotella sp.]MCI1474214.1 hypothetical protein [Prevotella sp.]MCI1519004.1 hypothetical protein [Prevotella sp.]